MRWGRTVALTGALGVVLLPAASASPSADVFSAARPVSWVSVAAGDPARVWVETAAGGFLSDDFETARSKPPHGTSPSRARRWTMLRRTGSASAWSTSDRSSAVPSECVRVSTFLREVV